MMEFDLIKGKTEELKLLLEKISNDIVYVGGSYILWLNGLMPHFDDIDIIVYTQRDPIPYKKDLSNLLKVNGWTISDPSSHITGNMRYGTPDNWTHTFYAEKDSVKFNLLIKMGDSHKDNFGTPFKQDQVLHWNGFAVMPIISILKAKNEYNRYKDLMHFGMVKEAINNIDRAFYNLTQNLTLDKQVERGGNEDYGDVPW